MKLTVYNQTGTWSDRGLRWVAHLACQAALQVTGGGRWPVHVCVTFHSDLQVPTARYTGGNRGGTRCDFGVHVPPEPRWDDVVWALSDVIARKIRGASWAETPRVAPPVVMVERLKEPSWSALGRLRTLDDLPRRQRDALRIAAEARHRAERYERLAATLQERILRAPKVRAKLLEKLAVQRAAWELSRDPGSP